MKRFLCIFFLTTILALTLATTTLANFPKPPDEPDAITQIHNI